MKWVNDGLKCTKAELAALSAIRIRSSKATTLHVAPKDAYVYVTDAFVAVRLDLEPCTELENFAVSLEALRPRVSGLKAADRVVLRDGSAEIVGGQAATVKLEPREFERYPELPPITSAPRAHFAFSAGFVAILGKLKAATKCDRVDQEQLDDGSVTWTLKGEQVWTLRIMPYST